MSNQSTDIGIYRALSPKVFLGEGVATIPFIDVSRAGGSAHQPRRQVLDCGREAYSYTDYIKRVVWKQY